MKKTNRYNLSGFIFSVVLLIWFFLPSSFFYGDFNKLFEVKSFSGNYKVVAYFAYPVSPYSLYKIMKSEGYFFVLFNKCDDVVFKPPLSYGTSSVGAYDGIDFGPNKKSEKHLFYPGVNGYESLPIKSGEILSCKQ